MRLNILCCPPPISNIFRKYKAQQASSPAPAPVRPGSGPPFPITSTRFRMRAAIVEQVGGEPKIVDDFERPKPGPGQVLVKSLYTAINPVDSFMAQYGLLVQEWPLVLGVDASGIIVESTPEAESRYNLTKGSYVCGCTRLGMKSYSTGQEYYLMDAAVTILKPENIDLKQAATLGVGIETAALAVFDGLKIPLMALDDLPAKRDGEWAVVLGGASSVGTFAVQLLKVAGYSVIASCGKKSTDMVMSLGADETFDYSLSISDQLKKVLDVTSGNIIGVFDAAASNDPVIAKELFKSDIYKPQDKKLFATTNDWSGITDFEGGTTYAVALGPVGREDATELNGLLERYIPVLGGLVSKGLVRTGEYMVVEKEGLEGVVEGYLLKSGGGGGSKKVVVKVGEE